MLPEVRTSPDVWSGPAPKDKHHAGCGSLGADFIIDQPADSDIARGSAGDCCIRCGRVGIKLPVDHGCKSSPPNNSLGEGFDAQHARDFLDQVFGECPSGRIGVCAIGNGPTRHAHFQWIRDAAQQAKKWDQLKPVGVYFRVTMLPPTGPRGSGRGDRADAHMLNFLWADLDYDTVGHKKPAGPYPLPATENDARLLIDGMPEPTLVVHSGGGLYPIWILNKPILITDNNRSDIEKLSERWQNTISRRAQKLQVHYGNVGDLPRVLRLPGSVNRKAGIERPCRVIEYTGRRLEL
jgi:putative DNA primase/helicase